MLLLLWRQVLHQALWHLDHSLTFRDPHLRLGFWIGDQVALHALGLLTGLG
jgi:hypothetical protein